MSRRFIEIDFPIALVSKHSVREKNIRHGHISTLHIWWARRPLAASRASIYAALIPGPDDEEERLKKARFIADLCRWENSLDPHFIEKARREILEANSGKPPRVLDCFAGGGSIPLEALRLGCEAYALELNPVAVLILKATLEYPQKYGDPEVVRRLRPPQEETLVQGQLALKKETSQGPTLVDDVRYWGQWVLEEAHKELAQFYPKDADESIPVGHIWARTVRCQNPDCGTEIPLMRQFWLARKKDKRIALRPLVDRERKRVEFEIVKGEVIDFDPSAGTVRRANVACPVCGAGIEAKTLRREFREGRAGERMLAVVLHPPNRTGKTYRLATPQDVAIYQSAEAALEKKRRSVWNDWGIDPVPHEEAPGTLGSNAKGDRYNFLAFGDYFQARQKLMLITFVEKARHAHKQMLARGYEAEYAKALLTYVALGIDMAAAFGNTLARWENTSQAIKHTFSRQALPMLWDYVEANPFSGSTGSWETGWEYYQKVIQHCATSTRDSPGLVTVQQGTATRLFYPDDYFDAVVTDPPYYDNVNYSVLSDFFYVWLKRTAGYLYPELFATPLTPKSQEIVQDQYRLGSREAAKASFEGTLTEALHEVCRVLKPEGIALIVFAHKSLDAWETVIQSLLRSGLVLTASWPVHTEMKARLVAQETASLASSVYMVCRKRLEEKASYFNEIRPAIEQRIQERLKQFWNEGIGGADFFISAIGPAVEVFGQYSRVERLSGEEVTVRELLEYVRRMVVRFALERILKSPQIGDVDNETLFYLLWRWTYKNARTPFDDARKLGQAVGVEVTEHWGPAGFIGKEKEYIRVLGPTERGKHLLEGRGAGSIGPGARMIDVLHRCMLLWQRSDRKAIGELLVATGYGANDIFWQVAQAISEVLPEGDKERQLVQGFLYGRQQYQAAAKAEQPTLFDMSDEVEK